jgi:hypothetical protein
MKHTLLLISSDDEPTPELERTLAVGGFDVRRCHEPRSPSFPCAGIGPGVCPLDDGRVDVALDVRDHPWPQPTGHEAGVRCALREGVPLVVAGRSRANPFARWATIIVDGTGDAASACLSATKVALDRHVRAATDATLQVLAADGLDPVPVAVDASRVGGDLHVRVTVDLPPALHSIAATRIGSALRAVDRRANRIEIEISDPGAHLDPHGCVVPVDSRH